VDDRGDERNIVMSSDTVHTATATAPVPHDHVVFTDLDGTEGVLVDLNTKQYFQLNATASLIWRGLARRAPADAIAQQMAAEYDVTIDHARRSVEAAIREFVAHRLVTAA
jgi:Coenzyme PQQ synthesis protein D (PqqD)